MDGCRARLFSDGETMKYVLAFMLRCGIDHESIHNVSYSNVDLGHYEPRLAKLNRNHSVTIPRRNYHFGVSNVDQLSRGHINTTKRQIDFAFVFHISSPV